MQVKCPECKGEARALFEEVLPNGLRGQRCPQCLGVWVRGEHYYAWLDLTAEQRKAGHAESAASGVKPDVTENRAGKARLCPECGRMMTRYEVGNGADFMIGRCSNCAGVWLDAGEFEALVALGLVDKLHFVASTAWQADLMRIRQQEAYENLLLDKLGEADMAEARRVKAWADKHAHRAEILAYLSK